MHRAQSSVDCAEVCLETLSLLVTVHWPIVLWCSRPACLLIVTTYGTAMPFVTHGFRVAWQCHILHIYCEVST